MLLSDMILRVDLSREWELKIKPFFGMGVVTSSVGAAGLVDGCGCGDLSRLRGDLPNCRVEMTSRDRDR